MTSLSSASVRPLSLAREVASELFGTAVRDECRDRDQAAVSLGELRAFPDVAKQNVVGERDQLRCEVADRLCAGVCCSGSVTSMLRSNSFLPTDTDRSSQHPDRRAVAVPAVPGNGRTSQARRPARSVEGMDSRNEIRDFLATRRARITPEQAGLPPTAATAGWPGCAAKRSRCSPASASTTTPGSNGGTSPASPTACWTPSPARCSSTRPNGHTFRPGPRRQHLRRHGPRPAAARPAHVRPEVQRLLDAMTMAPAFVRNGRLDVLAPTCSAGPSSRRCSTPRPPRRTSPGSSSSTRPRRTSTSTGNASPATPSRCCAPRPAATRTTGP